MGIRETGTPYRSLDAFAPRAVAAGRPLQPWLMAGPFFHDVSDSVTGRSFFEAQNAPSTTGTEVFRAHLVEAEHLLSSLRPAEGVGVKLWGEQAAFRLLLREEPIMAWGNYTPWNTVVGALFTTRITPANAGPLLLEIHVQSDNQLIVTVDGEIRYQSYAHGFEVAGNSWHARTIQNVELDLRATANAVTIGAFRMGRVARGGLFVRCPAADLTVSVPLAPARNGVSRAEIEQILDSVHPVRGSYHLDEALRMQADGGTPPEDVQIQCRALRGQTVLGEQTLEPAVREVDLGPAPDAKPGPIRLQTRVLAHGDVLGSRSFHAAIVKPTRAVPGYERYAERVRTVLDYFAGHPNLWGQLARYASDRVDEIDEQPILAACDKLDKRWDCADFDLQPLLRMLLMDRERHALPAALVERATEACLAFRYWIDEPGDDCLVTGTENHKLLFHAAELLAGALWPDKTFSNSGLTGAQHLEKARTLAEKWLQDRLRYGFREWHSSSYYPVWMMGVLNILDFCPPQTRQLAKLAHAVLTTGFFHLAAGSFEGILGTTHGRVYARMLTVPEHDGCAELNWLLYGTGHLGIRAHGAVPLATSQYRPPRLLADIATDPEVSCSRHRQYDANFIVYRTPDYMLSALQDYRPGERSPQVHVFQLTLPEQTLVFFSCPDTSQEGSGLRPDYWSGNAFLPRVFAEKNVAVLLCRFDDTGWLSHCYLERDRFDEIVELDPWLFARKRNAYVAVWSEHGYEIGQTGQYAGRELVCRAPHNAWVVEAGRKTDWGTFPAFVAAIREATPSRRDGRLVYRSPSVGTIDMAWSGPIRLNGEPAKTRYPLLDSPYGHSKYGSGRMDVRYHGQELRIPDDAIRCHQPKCPDPNAAKIRRTTDARETARQEPRPPVARDKAHG